MPFWGWSKTAATNASADPTINWAEGQPPGSVNDSGRAMMARTSEWRDDISGTIMTGGTLNAYTLTTNQGFDLLTHLNGAMLAFVPHVTNGAIVTLAVDGGAARPLRSSPGVEIGAGVLVQGTPYVVTYNNSDGAFYLQNFFGNPFNIPIGGLMPYLGATTPNANFILPFGQAISRTTYATLFALVGTTFGAGDGVTTFGVPDLRDRAIFGLGNMGGVDAARITIAGGNFNGAILGNAGGVEAHTLTQAEMPSHTHAATVNDAGHGHPVANFNGTGSGGNNGLQGVSAANNTQTPSNLTAIAQPTGITVTNAGAGSGNSHPILNPCMVLPYILRVI